VNVAVLDAETGQMERWQVKCDCLRLELIQFGPGHNSYSHLWISISVSALGFPTHCRINSMPTGTRRLPQSLAHCASHAAPLRVCSEGDTLCQCAVQTASILKFAPQSASGPMCCLSRNNSAAIIRRCRSAGVSARGGSAVRMLRTRLAARHENGKLRSFNRGSIQRLSMHC
jgi:hypothetical protein